MVAPVAGHLIAPVLVNEVLDWASQPEASLHPLEEQSARSDPILVSIAKDRQAHLAVEMPLTDERPGPLHEESVPVDQGVVQIEYDQTLLWTNRHGVSLNLPFSRFPRWPLTVDFWRRLVCQE